MPTNPLYELRINARELLREPGSTRAISTELPAVREYVLLELPDAPLCRDDCAGICPSCGVDRNRASCDCDTTVRDERWAVLDELRLDDGDG